MICRATDGYLKWLMDKVGDWEGYTKLFRALCSYDFYSKVANDDNRVTDGLILRDNYDGITGLEGFPCTVLELLIGLSIRVGEEILWDGETNYANIIFWTMISNLQLEQQTDENFDDGYFEHRIDLFLDRNYGQNCDGALFFPSHFSSHFSSQFPKKWEKTEIWRQMQCWLNENFL